MTARDLLLTRVRGALGRSPGAPVPEPPPVRSHLPETPVADRPAQFTTALTALAGKVHVVRNLDDAWSRVETIVNGRTFVSTIGAKALPDGRASLAAVDAGVNWADFALADSGSLVFLSESHQSRLISLLPPVHIAIVARDKILSGLDELYTLVPQPAVNSSSMVIVTGPSRTADIEMRLVRGVHGPGEVHVIIVEDVDL